jgi:hypothetical protein
MDRDEVEVRHRGTNDVRVEVTVLEPVDSLRHEPGDVLGSRSFVGRGPAARIGDIDRASTPKAGELVTLGVAGVKVQVEDDPLAPSEVRIDRHDSDVVHRPRVGGDREPILVVRGWLLISGDQRDRFAGGDGEALDRHGALNRACADLGSGAAFRRVMRRPYRGSQTPNNGRATVALGQRSRSTFALRNIP